MPKKSIVMRIKHINIIRRSNFINSKANGTHIINSFLPQHYKTICSYGHKPRPKSNLKTFFLLHRHRD